MWLAPFISSLSVPTQQLWAIMLRNASDVFIQQISQRKFIEVLEDVLISQRTSPVVRERLMEVLAAAAFITSSRRSFVDLHGRDTYPSKQDLSRWGKKKTRTASVPSGVV
jgi:uncharacterized linocin/CFP29 family protein